MDALRTAVERRMVADVPVGVLLSGGIDSSIVVALLAEQGQHGLATFSHRFRLGRRRIGRRVLLLRPDRQGLRHRPPPHPHRQLAVAAGGAENHCGDERTDGQPRLRRVLPAVRGSQQVGQGGAVRPGRRRDSGWLRLVPAAGELWPASRPPRPTPRCSSTAITPTCWRSSPPSTALPPKTRVASSSWRTRPRRAPRPRSTPRCGWIRR